MGKRAYVFVAIIVATAGIATGRAGASTPVPVTGSAQCSLGGKATFTPALADGGVGSGVLKVKASFVNCTGGVVRSGKLLATGTVNTRDCAAFFTPGVAVMSSLTGTIAWKALNGAATPSQVSWAGGYAGRTGQPYLVFPRGALTGSFAGQNIDLDALVAPVSTAIARVCASRKGVTSLTFNKKISSMSVYDAIGTPWLHQFGTPANDGGFAIATAPNGTTSTTVLLDNVAEVVTYDVDGNLLWTTPLPGVSMATGITVDDAGEVLVTGDMGLDSFVTKLTSAGAPVWTRPIASAGLDHSLDVRTDANGNAYVVGGAEDALAGEAGTGEIFVVKYDADGNQLWAHRLEGEISGGHPLAVDGGGNAYVAGAAEETLPGSPEVNIGGDDAFVRKLDTNGTEQWLHEFGTSVDDYATAITADSSGRVDIAGFSAAAAHTGWVAQFDGTGNRNWFVQFGEGATYPLDVAVDAGGTLHVGGNLNTTLAGAPESPFGSTDLFVTKFDANGNALDGHLFGSRDIDYFFGVAVDAAGRVFATGYTLGTMAGGDAPFVGATDVYITRLPAGA